MLKVGVELPSKPDLRRHYDKSSVVGPAVLGEIGWYDIAVQKISVGDQEFTGFGCAPSSGQQCIMVTRMHPVAYQKRLQGSITVTGSFQRIHIEALRLRC